MRAFAVAVIVAACAASTVRGRGSDLVARDVYLMGTRAQLVTLAPTREAGLATLDSALASLEHTEHELSTWQDSSDISALNRQPVSVPWHASPGLCRMFDELWQWHAATGGAFDPAIGRLLAAWDIHGEGLVPTGAAQRRARSASGLALLAFDRARCTVTKRGDVAMDVGAFGKGEALDRVGAALGAAPWLIDLGGQVAIGGTVHTAGWPVAIADPRDRREPYLEVRLLEGSLSTSGGSERDHVVNGKRIAHIFDPRTGEPASFNGSVTVWHRSALAADVLSTALFVMGPDAGLRWAERHDVAAVYLIPKGDRVRVESTDAWAQGRGLKVTERE
jgi:thiamine biosynthesis lipoprotein